MTNELYSSPNIFLVIRSKRIRWVKHVTCMEMMKGVFRVLVEKPNRKRTFGRPKRIWEDTIQTDLQDVGCGIVDWIEVAQNRDG